MGIPEFLGILEHALLRDTSYAVHSAVWLKVQLLEETLALRHHLDHRIEQFAQALPIAG